MNTIIDRLNRYAADHPQEIVYSFYRPEGLLEKRSYAKLRSNAATIAQWLRNADMVGKPVLLVYPPGLEFVDAFIGCLAAGIHAIPVVELRGKSGRHGLDPFQEVVQDSGAWLALTTHEKLATFQYRSGQRADLEHIKWIATDELPPDPKSHDSIPAPQINDIAFIQYTSGSTSSPSGVQVRHSNLFANLQLIQQKFGHNKHSSGVIWLPHFHDMGLIGGILQPLFAGFPVVLLAPQVAVRDPLTWLRLIDSNQATTSGGPNFIYDLCVEKVTDFEAAELDLSTWDLAFTGAEPVNAATMERFCDKFAASGFRRTAIYPVYGLAESTLMVTGGEKLTGMITENIDGRVCVSCGSASPEHKIKIVDPISRAPVDRDRSGEIWVSGPSVSSGYLHAKGDKQQVFGNRLAGDDDGVYVATGDIGVVIHDNLFITGRSRDMIIVRGQNYHAVDIEHCARLVSSDIKQSVAFVGQQHGVYESLIVVCEISRKLREPSKQERLRQNIQQSIHETHLLTECHVELVPEGSIPRTSSGKLRKQACRDLYFKGQLRLIRGIPTEFGPDESLTQNAVVELPEVSELIKMDNPERVAVLEGWLKEKVTQLLPPSVTYSNDRTLLALGIDSLKLVELQIKIEPMLAIESTTNFHGMTVPDISRFISSAIPGTASLTSSRHAKKTGRISPAKQLTALTPAQHESLETFANPDQNVIELLLRVPKGANSDDVRVALESTVSLHESLGVTIRSGPNGWEQRVKCRPTIPWENCKAALSGVSNPRELGRQIAQKAMSSLSIRNGVACYASYVDNGVDRHDLLRLDFNHLCVDSGSLIIFITELNSIWENKPLKKPAISYRQWTAALEAHAHSIDQQLHREVWTDICQVTNVTGAPGELRNSSSTTKPVIRAINATMLDKITSERVLSTFPGSRTQHDLVLAALVQAWNAITGQQQVTVRVESHGRTALDNMPAPRRLTGWLTDKFPISISVTPGESFDMLLNRTTRARDAVSEYGKGFGLLKYLHSDTTTRQYFHNLPVPALNFTYRPYTTGWFRSDMSLPVIHARGHPGFQLRSDAPAMYTIHLNAFIQDWQVCWQVYYDATKIKQADAVRISESVKKSLLGFLS